MTEVFQCKKCGQCCEGRGGIILTERDLLRLSALLCIPVEQTIDAYTETIAGKLSLAMGEDGYCCFFRAGIGCAVHEGKPDICRAWPFFRGNLRDPISFELARDYCPGISKTAAFEIFKSVGEKYMRDEDLFAEDSSPMPNALKF